MTLRTVLNEVKPAVRGATERVAGFHLALHGEAPSPIVDKSRYTQHAPHGAQSCVNRSSTM